MSLYPQRSLWPALLAGYLGIACNVCPAADVAEIVQRATAALNLDWAADPTYASVERDEVQKGEELTSNTFEVVMIDGSEYRYPLAVDDRPLPPARRRAELLKLRKEVWRRQNESPSSRRARVDEWKKQRDENGELLLDFPSVLTFQFLREEIKDGHSAYVLAATPRRDVSPGTRAARVLSGMQGTVWVDKDTLHPMRVECTVVTPVPVYGGLASVLPGTRIEIAMTPVTDSTWLIDEVSMKLSVSKLHVVKSTKMTRSTYSDYRLNSAVLEELLAQAGGAF